MPVAAGWSIVHGQHLAAYSALSGLSRAGRGSQDLPADQARALAEAFDAPRATVWMGPPERLLPVGVWPDGEQGVEPVDLGTLRSGPGLARAVEHLALLRDAARQRATADLDRLSPREREVLELMAAASPTPPSARSCT